MSAHSHFMLLWTRTYTHAHTHTNTQSHNHDNDMYVVDHVVLELYSIKIYETTPCSRKLKLEEQRLRCYEVAESVAFSHVTRDNRGLL